MNETNIVLFFADDVTDMANKFNNDNIKDKVCIL